jgi:hypothetical protein
MLIKRGYSKGRDSRSFDAVVKSLGNRRLIKQQGRYIEEQKVEVHKKEIVHKEVEQVEIPKSILLSFLLFIFAITLFLGIQIYTTPAEISSMPFWTYVLLLSFSSGFLVVVVALLLEKR